MQARPSPTPPPRNVPLGIHPGAGRAADGQADALVAALRAAPSPTSADPPADLVDETGRNADRPAYQPPLHVAASITADDIIGPLIQTQTDRAGHEIARSAFDREGALVLDDDRHAAFLKIVRTLHGQPALRDAVSEETVRDVVFDWLLAAARGPDVPVESAEKGDGRAGVAPPAATAPGLSTFVVERCARLITNRTVLVPISGLHVEVPIRIGRVVIAEISPSELASWREQALHGAPASGVPPEQVAEEHDRLSRELVGLAGARLTVRAEPGHAVQRAVEETELSLAVLRLCSTGAFIPERPTLFAPLGRGHVPRQTVLLLRDGAGPSVRTSILSVFDSQPAVFGADELRNTVLPVVAPWSALLARDDRTAFEADALRSMLLYARATTYRNLSEKLLHIFSAVEGLLLRNDTEPISAALAERLAFAVGRTPAERLEIAKRLRTVYGMRSRYVHHAVETPPAPDELRVLEAFLLNVAHLFEGVGGVLQRYPTREAFLDALERRKYA